MGSRHPDMLSMLVPDDWVETLARSTYNAAQSGVQQAVKEDKPSEGCGGVWLRGMCSGM